MPQDQPPSATGGGSSERDDSNPSGAAGGRDRNAEARDRNAKRRDRNAEDRDRVAEANQRDRAAPKAGADEHDNGMEADATAVGERVASSRDRGAASDDRAHSAEDRGVAASDRLLLGAQLSLERERSLRLTTQLANLADNDPVTGLLNRSKFEEELEVHLARYSRYGGEGSFLLIRLEGLDDIAKGLKHADAGQLLAALADRLTGRLRETDRMGRWGPNELAILLPVADADRAECVADMLLDLVAGTATSEVAAGSLNASIGLAPIGSTSTASHIVAHASQAMSATRRGGAGPSPAH